MKEEAKFEFSVKKQEAEDLYKRYDLRSNPFPMKAIAGSGITGPFLNISEDVKNRIEEFVSGVLSTKKWGGLPIVGPVGSGKTRMLLKIKEDMESNPQIKRTIAIYYLENPGPDIRVFYGKVLETIKLNNLIRILAKIYETDLLAKLDSNCQKRKDVLGNALLYVTADLKLFDDVTDLFIEKRFSLNQDIAKSLAVLSLEYVMDNISTILPNLRIVRDEKKYQDYRGAAEDYLTGRTISKKDRNLLKLSSSGLSNHEIIKYAFPMILEILMLDEKNMLLILLDEFENIVGSRTKTRDFLNDLRSVVDNNLLNFSMILGCMVDAWLTSTRTDIGFSERFADSVELPKLKFETAKEIVILYLDAERITDEKRGTIFPFTESAIRYMLANGFDTPRKLLEKCYEMLAKADKETYEINEKTIESLIPKMDINKQLTLDGNMHHV